MTRMTNSAMEQDPLAWGCPQVCAEHHFFACLAPSRHTNQQQTLFPASSHHLTESVILTVTGTLTQLLFADRQTVLCTCCQHLRRRLMLRVRDEYVADVSVGELGDKGF